MFAGFALGYDLMFGRTGLLSFGHALYIAGGAYGTQLAMTELSLGLLPAALLTLLLGSVAAAVLGAISLRTLALGGIGFAMVTLAFAQAGAIWIERNPGGLTGGEEGLPLHTAGVPDVFLGVTNTVNVYWLALAYLVVVAAVVWTATASSDGKVWQGVRDNEQRIAVLGRDPIRYKLGGLRPRLRARAARRHRAPAGHRRRDPALQHSRVHAHAAGDGRPGRCRYALGPGVGRRPVHLP